MHKIVRAFTAKLHKVYMYIKTQVTIMCDLESFVIGGLNFDKFFYSYTSISGNLQLASGVSLACR